MLGSFHYNSTQISEI